MTAYYNEHDEYAAQWLRNLIAAGRIAPGDVDTRDLWDVKPDDLKSYTQVHFCAGIGIWSHALRSADWPDDRPIWSGSFPCQPFSAAGKGLGFADERHLWPAGHYLVRECRPPVVIGEQVGGSRADEWVDLVQADLEAEGYAFGIVETCAAGFGEEDVGGFHIRQRNYWVAHTYDTGPQGRIERGDSRGQRLAGPGGVVGGLANTQRPERPGGVGAERAEHDARGREQGAAEVAGLRRSGGLAHHQSERRDGIEDPPGQDGRASPQAGSGTFGAGSLHSLGRNVDWLLCRDAKWRPVEGGTFPLAHEDTARVGRLRAYGNALDAAQAEGFVRAFLACCP